MSVMQDAMNDLVHSVNDHRARIAALEAELLATCKREAETQRRHDATVEALEAQIAEMLGALHLADEALMSEHGCFPIDRTNNKERLLNDAASLIRSFTGDDYDNRKRMAIAALAAYRAARVQP